MSTSKLERHPKIYVVTEEPFHDNSTLRFATLDIDQAFAFAQRILGHLESGLSESVEISELDGEAGVSRSWIMGCDPRKPEYGKWSFKVVFDDRPFQYVAYEHVPEGAEKRKERLIEAAEIIMGLAITELP